MSIMNESLKNLVKSFNILSDNEIEKGLGHFQPHWMKKNEYLIHEGEVCNWLAFVVSGVFRNYYTSSKHEEVTYCLAFPNTFITAYSSFITQKKTFENIIALSNAEVLIIKQAEFQQLVDANSQWNTFARIFAEQSYLLMENRLLALQMESAEKRYRDLLHQNPEYLQHVPLKYLASYLGVTQRHLSRLRKSFAN